MGRAAGKVRYPDMFIIKYMDCFLLNMRGKTLGQWDELLIRLVWKGLDNNLFYDTLFVEINECSTFIELNRSFRFEFSSLCIRILFDLSDRHSVALSLRLCITEEEELFRQEISNIFMIEWDHFIFCSWLFIKQIDK